MIPQYNYILFKPKPPITTIVLSTRWHPTACCVPLLDLESSCHIMWCLGKLLKINLLPFTPHPPLQESTMAEESHRSSAAEISVTTNGDLDQSPETVFQMVWGLFRDSWGLLVSTVLHIIVFDSVSLLASQTKPWKCPSLKDEVFNNSAIPFFCLCLWLIHSVWYL